MPGRTCRTRLKCLVASREAARIDPADLATRNLKNKLEQAVLFADSQQNPLTFDLTLTNDTGDLVSAAESVSHDILTSSELAMYTTSAARLVD